MGRVPPVPPPMSLTVQTRPQAVGMTSLSRSVQDWACCSSMHFCAWAELEA
jgi:hypothetical protein